MDRKMTDAPGALDEIRSLRDRGDSQLVLARFGQIDQVRGPQWDDLDLVLEVAKAHSLAGNETAVERFFQRCAELRPDRTAIFLLQIGWFYHRKKKWARALAWYDRALQTFPSYHLCLFRKGYCLERLHRPRAAADALRQAAMAFDSSSRRQQERSHGIQVQVLFHLARNLREIGATEEARAALDRVAELDQRPHDVVIKEEHRLASYGETYLRDRRTAEAMACLERAHALDPRSAVIWERLGLALEQAGRVEEAVAALRTAVDLPKGSVALLSLARLQLHQEQLAEAAATLRAALDRHPQGEVQIRIEIAELHRRLGRPAAALEELRALARGRVPPGSTLAVEVESRIAQILLDHHDIENATTHLQRALAHDPDAAGIQIQLADLSHPDHARQITMGAEEGARPLVDLPLPPGFPSLLDDPRPRCIGTIANYLADRGYGFIATGDAGETVFFHVSHCDAGMEAHLVPGTPVSFVRGANVRKAKPQAEKIRLVATSESSGHEDAPRLAARGS